MLADFPALERLAPAHVQLVVDGEEGTSVPVASGFDPVAAILTGTIPTARLA